MSDSCDPRDCGPPRSSVHGISQAGILEWAAISSSKGSSQHRDQTRISSVSCIASRSFTTGSLGKCHISIFTYICVYVDTQTNIYIYIWRWKWQPTPGFLPGEAHEQGSLACYCSWGHKESDTTEQLSTYIYLTQGNPSYI